MKATKGCKTRESNPHADCLTQSCVCVRARVPPHAHAYAYTHVDTYVRCYRERERESRERESMEYVRNLEACRTHGHTFSRTLNKHLHVAEHCRTPR